MLASFSSGAFVLVGKSSRTKCSNGNNALSWTSMTCRSSRRRQTRYSLRSVPNPYRANDERKSLKVGRGWAATCSTDSAFRCSGKGSTAASAVQRATWSTGTMLTVLLMSGTNPSWIQPLTIRQMKSSVLVTAERHHPSMSRHEYQAPHLPADRESPTTYPGRTTCPFSPLRPASNNSFSETHLLCP